MEKALHGRRVRGSQQDERLQSTTAGAVTDTIFPNVVSFLTVLATLPPSACKAEMFSKVDLTGSDIRSTISEERLEALVLLQARRSRLPS